MQPHFVGLLSNHGGDCESVFVKVELNGANGIGDEAFKAVPGPGVIGGFGRDFF